MYKLKIGFPAMSLIGSDAISGQLVELKPGSELILQLLDQFYGFVADDPGKSFYLRKSITVSCEDRSTEEVWVYVLNDDRMPADVQLIPNGDWINDLKTHPPLAEQLTERQRNYVLKLGASTGREIVPIDLPLYRELLKLELIVDKGRRLALSKFGLEVYKHL